MHPMILLVFCLVLFLPSKAFAYFDPGLGVSFLGTLLAVGGSIVGLIGLALAWPLKKVIRRKKQNQEKEQDTTEE